MGINTHNTYEIDYSREVQKPHKVIFTDERRNHLGEFVSYSKYSSKEDFEGCAGSFLCFVGFLKGSSND